MMAFWGWQATIAIAVLIGVARSSWAAEWTPDKWANESTITLCTHIGNEGRHCFPVWMGVLDHEVYVRLGTRAAGRVGKIAPRGATNAAMAQDRLAIEIAGNKFDQLTPVSSPSAAKRVAAAMAEKYWLDLIVRFLPHPMTVMLAPDIEVP